MSQDNLASNAAQRLQSFMKEMYIWETSLSEAQKASGGKYFDGHKETIRASLKQIYDTFLTNKERKTGRLASLNFGIPLEFDPNKEKITATEMQPGGKKIVIETIYPTYLEFRRRYTLVLLSGEWWIDKREDFSPLKGKWTAVTL